MSGYVSGVFMVTALQGSCVGGEEGRGGGFLLPVRPRTLMTFTSLTGTLDASIFATWAGGC